MKYAVEMGSIVMIYIPRCINIRSGIKRLLGGGSQTHRHDGGYMSLLQESRLGEGREQKYLAHFLTFSFTYQIINKEEHPTMFVVTFLQTVVSV
jgi:hypothetical protein